MAARVDACHESTDARIGKMFREEIEKKLDKLQEPPPVKFVKLGPDCPVGILSDHSYVNGGVPENILTLIVPPELDSPQLVLSIPKSNEFDELIPND